MSKEQALQSLIDENVVFIERSTYGLLDHANPEFGVKLTKDFNTRQSLPHSYISYYYIFYKKIPILTPTLKGPVKTYRMIGLQKGKEIVLKEYTGKPLIIRHRSYENIEHKVDYMIKFEDFKHDSKRLLNQNFIQCKNDLINVNLIEKVKFEEIDGEIVEADKLHLKDYYYQMISDERTKLIGGI